MVPISKTVPTAQPAKGLNFPWIVNARDANNNDKAIGRESN